MAEFFDYCFFSSNFCLCVFVAVNLFATVASPVSYVTVIHTVSSICFCLCEICMIFRIDNNCKIIEYIIFCIKVLFADTTCIMTLCTLFNASCGNFVNPIAVSMSLCSNFFFIRITANRTCKGLFTLVFASGFFCYFFIIAVTCCINIRINIRIAAPITSVSCITLFCTSGSSYKCLVIVSKLFCKYRSADCTFLIGCTCSCCTGGMSLCCNFCLFS